MTGSLAALLLVAGLSACAGDPKDQPTTLPPITATPTPSPTSTAGMSDRDQVRATYVGLLAHFEAAPSLSTSQRKRDLAMWAINPALQSYVDGASVLRRKHQRYVGHSVPHITRIDMTGDTALVHDCDDSSQRVVKDIRTGREVSRGRSHLLLTAELRRTGRGWRVYASDAKEEPCTRR